MKILFNDDFKVLCYDGNKVFNKIKICLQKELKIKYDCKVNEITGGLEILPLTVNIPQNELRKITHGIIVQLASAENKLLDEIGDREYFTVTE